MAISEAFPGPSAVVDSLELRKNLAGLIVRDTAGVPRAGVFPRHANALVSSTATMSVNVAAFEAALLRTGPLFVQNDGTVAVTIATAPVSNSRIDVVWARQPENGYNGFADGSNTPLISVTAGTAAASPVKPAIPAGALELATVLVPAGATATNSGGVVITQTFQYTAAAGGTVWVRNVTERNAWTPAGGSTAYQVDTDAHYYRRGGGWVAANSDGVSFAGPPLFGSAWDGVSPLIVKKGSATASTVASGDASIIFASAFPNGMLHADVRRRDFTSYGATSEILHVTQALDRVNFRVYTAGGTALASAPTIPFVFEAIGW